jgi:hypothetical protein
MGDGMVSGYTKLVLLTLGTLMATPTLANNLTAIPMTRAEAWCIAQKRDELMRKQSDPISFKRPLKCNNVEMPIPERSGQGSTELQFHQLEPSINFRETVYDPESSGQTKIFGVPRINPVNGSQVSITVARVFFLNMRSLNCFVDENFPHSENVEDDRSLLLFEAESCDFRIFAANEGGDRDR